ncbi:MAG: MinD/ParA family protein [Candidatus Omnitrophica bacterium]|nr:MinD/ParA family protein [Candidatus Omnitrophota bacterium]
MFDQAQRLREMVGGSQATSLAIVPPPPAPLAKHARTIAVTSGKGGVGKTNIVTNLAIALGRRGKKVLLVDADLSLANVDVVLGLQPRFNLSHVISGEKRLREIVLEGPHSIRIIPAASGIQEMANLRDEDIKRLISEFAEFDREFDLILIDTAAGISESVLSFAVASQEVLLVTTPEPTSYVDAYQMLKNIHFYSPAQPVHLIVNMAANQSEGEQTASFMNEMANRFLQHSLNHIGTVVRDPDVPASIRLQRPFLEESPHGPAARGIQQLSTRLLNQTSNREEGGQPEKSLWSKVIQFVRKGAVAHAG